MPTHKRFLQRLDEKLQRLKALRPLPPSAVKKLGEQFELELTYNSNAIEGNSLTLQETFWVVTEGLTIHGKPLKDHLEAQDHHRAVAFLIELIDTEAQPTFSERLIKTLHQLVMKKTDEDWAGKYRTGQVMIGGAKHVPPPAVQVVGEMERLLEWFGQASQQLHPVELAALLHHKLVHIHPFFDGNGRTARLVMNVILLRAGYPLVVILKNDRKKYYKSLNQADEGSPAALEQFIAQAVERSLEIYLTMLTPDSEVTEKFVSLSDVSRETPYSAKYLNLLARQGKIEAYKRQRNWLISKEAIFRYMTNRERQRVLD